MRSIRRAAEHSRHTHARRRTRRCETLRLSIPQFRVAAALVVISMIVLVAIAWRIAVAPAVLFGTDPQVEYAVDKQVRFCRATGLIALACAPAMVFAGLAWAQLPSLSGVLRADAAAGDRRFRRDNHRQPESAARRYRLGVSFVSRCRRIVGNAAIPANRRTDSRRNRAPRPDAQRYAADGAAVGRRPGHRTQHGRARLHRNAKRRLAGQGRPAWHARRRKRPLASGRERTRGLREAVAGFVEGFATVALPAQKISRAFQQLSNASVR